MNDNMPGSFAHASKALDGLKAKPPVRVMCREGGEESFNTESVFAAAVRYIEEQINHHASALEMYQSQAEGEQENLTAWKQRLLALKEDAKQFLPKK